MTTTRIDSRSVLTTEHASSSYGIPVLVIDGMAYGPGDYLPQTVEGIPPATAATSLKNMVLTARARHSENGVVRGGNSFRERLARFALMTSRLPRSGLFWLPIPMARRCSTSPPRAVPATNRPA